MSEAREHAIVASTLLDAERELDARLEKLTPEERLAHVASGNVERLNRDRTFSLQLAQAQALTAIALALTERTLTLEELQR